MTIRGKDKDIFLNRQDKVNAEIFYAMEALGRRLEKTEDIRDGLKARLEHIESGAEVDQETGKFFLPLVIDPAQLPDGATKKSSSKTVVLSSFISFCFAVTALTAVMVQTPADTNFVTRAEFAKLNIPLNNQVAFADWKTVDDVAHQNKQNRVMDAVLKRLEENENTLAQIERRQRETENAYATVLAELQESKAYFAEGRAAGAEITEATVTAGVQQPQARKTEPRVTDVTKNTPKEPVTVASTGQKAQPKQQMQATEPVKKTAPVEKKSKETIWVAEAPQKSVTKAIQKTAQNTNKNTTRAQRTKTVEPRAEDVAMIEPAAGMGVQRVSQDLRNEMKADAGLPSELKSLENRAFDGEAAAQHDLGALYASGQVMTADYKRAAYWFLKAAEQGVANAHYNLGVMYHQGLGLKRDVEKALYWYREAASLGHPEGLYNLGIAYVEGIGTKPDVDRGVGYLKRAANVGVAQAAYNLGVLYESHFGAGGTDDIDKAVQWYSYAGELGYTDGDAAVKRLTGKAALDMQGYGYGSGDGTATGQNILDIPDDLNDIETAAGYELFPPVAMMEEGSADEGEVFDVRETKTQRYNVQMVSRIQRILMDMDLLEDAKPTGDLDMKTADAIRAFQRKSGMTVDGTPSQNLLDYMLYNGRTE